MFGELGGCIVPEVTEDGPPEAMEVTADGADEASPALLVMVGGAIVVDDLEVCKINDQ